MKRILFVLFSLLTLCSFFACGNHSDGKTTVVATMFPQYDFARNISGERANVEMLLDFGADAHSYEPSPSDIIKISRADLFVYNGEEMELFAKKLLESADVSAAIERGDLKVLDLSESVELLPVHSHGEHEEEYDAHIWTSPENALAMCKSIANALTEIDTQNSAYYLENLEKYSVLLSELDGDFAAMKEKTVRNTVYFGGSFAFRYLFFELGLSHVSLYEGCASHAEPSAADIAAVADKMKSEEAKYVFYDSQSEKKIAETIAKECGAEVLHLHAVHNISKAEFESGCDYISLMKLNLQTLGKALAQ